MLHIGGLTFCGDAKQLRIPNLVAAERFGNATLARLGLRLEDVDLALQNIVNTGDIRQALSLYRQMICQRDVHPNDFKKTEEQHRDSFYFSFLGNSHPSLRRLEIEAKITKVKKAHLIDFFCYKISLMYANVSSYPQLSKSPGRIDMQITVPSAKRILVLEWKVLQLDFLDLGTPMSVENKADHLKGTFEAHDILNFRLVQHDRFRPGLTIEEWILKGDTRGNNKVSPRQQLADYMNSPEIAQLKTNYAVTAYLVVVVGSRQILCWKMGDHGRFREEDVQLAA